MPLITELRMDTCDAPVVGVTKLGPEMLSSIEIVIGEAKGGGGGGNTGIGGGDDGGGGGLVIEPVPTVCWVRLPLRS